MQRKHIFSYAMLPIRRFERERPGFEIDWKDVASSSPVFLSDDEVSRRGCQAVVDWTRVGGRYRREQLRGRNFQNVICRLGKDAIGWRLA